MAPSAAANEWAKPLLMTMAKVPERIGQHFIHVQTEQGRRGWSAPTAPYIILDLNNVMPCPHLVLHRQGSGRPSAAYLLFNQRVWSSSWWVNPAYATNVTLRLRCACSWFPLNISWCNAACSQGGEVRAIMLNGLTKSDRVFRKGFYRKLNKFSNHQTDSRFMLPCRFCSTRWMRCGLSPLRPGSAS